MKPGKNRGYVVEELMVISGYKVWLWRGSLGYRGLGTMSLSYRLQLAEHTGRPVGLYRGCIWAMRYRVVEEVDDWTMAQTTPLAVLWL